MPTRIDRRWVVAALAITVVLAGCRREVRSFRETPPTTRRQASAPESPYNGEAWAIAQGGQLFRWCNCVGCHSHGGGGIGPALIDAKWLYGDKPAEIFATIMEGRPNGMPAFRARLTDQQGWQLVAYIESLGGRVRFDVRTSREDTLNKGASPTPPPESDLAKRGGQKP